MKTFEVNGIEVTMTDEDVQLMLRQYRDIMDQLSDLGEEDEEELSSFEHKDKAIELIGEAYKHLMVALDTGTRGNEEFNNDYITTMEKSVIELIGIKRELKG